MPADPSHERRIAALESLLPAAMFDAIYADPHQWSSRPCRTCQTVTDLTGRSFGCVRFYADEKQRRDAVANKPIR